MYLSKGGNITLIKITLSNMPTYYMSLFSLLVGVANHIEKLQWTFCRVALVNISNSTWLPSLRFVLQYLKKDWRSGILIFFFNQALLGKWLWCYFHEREIFWRMVVDSKYGSSWGGWCLNEVYKSYRMGQWKNIRKGCRGVF